MSQWFEFLLTHEDNFLFITPRKIAWRENIITYCTLSYDNWYIHTQKSIRIIFSSGENLYNFNNLEFQHKCVNISFCAHQ